jgi:hypothetical protein
MAVTVPAEATPTINESCVPLALYAQIIHWDECSFWGVDRAPGAGYPAYAVWTKPERDSVARYLAEAQVEIEAEVGYPLFARWIADERRPYSFPLLSRWGKVIEAGVRATADIELDAAVDHATDPATVTVTTSVDEDEIHVYYPASLGVEGPVEITPSDVDISGTTVTIYIPRCRLVHPDYVDNPSTGLSYDDLDNFLDIVDVIRVYNDPSTHGTLVWPHACTGTQCTCPSCDDYTQDACIYVAVGEIGRLHLLPAEYSDGAWTRVTALCCGEPDYAIVNYRAGLEELSRQAVDAVIRLAHSKMPKEPCTDARMQEVWQRDRNVPDTLTRERVNCKFGLSDGAWTAWQFTLSLKLWRGSSL